MQDGRAVRKGEHAVVDSAMQALAQQILAGQRRALAKGITLVESTKPVHRLDASALLSNVMSATGGALRIGIWVRRVLENRRSLKRWDVI